MTPGDLSDDERAELDRLRAEVDALRAGKEADAEPGGGTAATTRGARRRLRWVAVGVLVTLVLVLTPVTVAARYVRGELLDTDRYVDTVAPLAGKPAVQVALANRITTEVMKHLKVEDNVDKAMQWMVDEGAPDFLTGLSSPISDQIANFTRDHIREFAASQTFANLWVEANRLAHAELDAALTGDTDGAVHVDDEGEVTLQLGPAIATVRQRLVDQGFGLASDIPEVNAELVLLDSPELARAQFWVHWFDRVATVLPFVVVALAALAVLAAPNRRTGVLAAAVAATVGCLLLGLALIVGRAWVVDTAVSNALSGDAAADVADAFLQPLRLTNRVVLVLGLVVILAVLVTGPSSAARQLRATVGQGMAALRRLALREREPTPLEAWVAANRAVLRVGIVAIGALVVVMAHYPTGAFVAAVALVVVGALVLVELVAVTGTGGRPATEDAGTPRRPDPQTA